MGVSVEIPDGPSGLGMTENLNPSFPASKASVGNLLLKPRTTKNQTFSKYWVIISMENSAIHGVIDQQKPRRET